MKTKIFCDTADYKIIKKFTKSSLVQGFTTNPSLMRLAGARNYENYAKNILKICSNKPISFEVFADDADEMIRQGLKIKEWGKNVYVKIPVTNSKGKFSGKAIRYLSHKNVKLNITAVYTTRQTIKIIRNLIIILPALVLGRQPKLIFSTQSYTIPGTIICFFKPNFPLEF